MGTRETDQVRLRLGSVQSAGVRSPDAVTRSAVADDTEPSPEWLTEEDFRATSAVSRFLPERWRGARLDIGRQGALALAAVGAVMVAIAAVSVFRSSPTASPVPPLPVVQTESAPTSVSVPSDAAGVAPQPDSTIVVSVVGLVPVSGLLHLPAGSRIADALAAAGGASAGADVLGLNLAQKLVDGDQIIVGAAATPPNLDGSGHEQVNVGSSASSTGGPNTAGTATPALKVNLNTATVGELDTLPGVGPVTAAAIIAWRDTNGKFVSADQLGEVNGIGPARLEKLRGEVTV